jgi:hypothetical protein
MTPRMRTDDARQALMAQADAVREAASTKILVKLDRDDIEAAWRGCDRAHANDYATFLGFFFPKPS